MNKVIRLRFRPRIICDDDWMPITSVVVVQALLHVRANFANNSSRTVQELQVYGTPKARRPFVGRRLNFLK